MGVVYEAEQVSLGRRVALKVLPFASAIDPRQRQRFLIEAQAAAQLHHPHIVPIYAAGCDQGVHFYAMQYVDGPASRSCWSSTASGPPRGGGSRDPVGHQARSHAREIARLGIQAAEALEHAHSLGVVHRDIKPANLLVDPRRSSGSPTSAWRQVRGDLSLTRSGDLVGTLRYMSPEQALARRSVVDQRTDIYSLGLTLYELLTLRPAFDGRDHRELLRQIAAGGARSPPAARPGDPARPGDDRPEGERKEPSGRYATAQELADDLARFLDDRPILARRPTRARAPCARPVGTGRSCVTAVTVLILPWPAEPAVVGLQAKKTARPCGRLSSTCSVVPGHRRRSRSRPCSRRPSPRWASGSEHRAGQEAGSIEKALLFYRRPRSLPPPTWPPGRSSARAHFRMGFTHAVMAVCLGGTAASCAAVRLAKADSHYREAIARFEALLAEAPRGRRHPQPLRRCAGGMGPRLVPETARRGRRRPSRITAAPRAAAGAGARSAG